MRKHKQSLQRYNRHWFYLKQPHAEDNRVKQVINGDYSVDTVFKHDRFGYVARIQLNGNFFILKNAEKRGRRRQVLWYEHLFCHLSHLGLACQQYLYMNWFINCGIPAPLPVLAIQRHHYGCVAESWLLMQEETIIAPITRQDFERTRALLKQFHQSGFLHGDPSPHNFVDTSRGLVALDITPKRNHLGRVGEALELYKHACHLQIPDSRLPSTWHWTIARILFKCHRRCKRFWDHVRRV